MIWIQALICFGIWITYGVVQARRSGRIREKVGNLSRSARGLLGGLLLVGGAVVLFGAMIGLDSIGGFTARGMTPLAWFSVAVVGLAFVHTQTMAMAMLVSLMQDSVTSPGSSASDDQTLRP